MSKYFITRMGKADVNDKLVVTAYKSAADADKKLKGKVIYEMNQKLGNKIPDLKGEEKIMDSLKKFL